MKVVQGIWLPDKEHHFATHPHLGNRYPIFDEALKYVRDRDTCIDIGAHVGLWTRWLVKEFKWVHAFEPIDEYADILKTNVPDKSVILHRCALGSHHGRVAMKKYPDNTGQAHICGNGVIPLWPMDCFQLKPGLIKIDVEGYELPVIKGGEKTIVQSKPAIVIEQRGVDEINFGFKKDEAMKWLKELGMKTVANVGCDYVMAW